MARLSMGELEAQVLDVLWEHGEPMTPGEVHRELSRWRKLAYTTVMTILVRLWQKGVVDREPAGRAYAYEPVETREERAASRMSELLEASGDSALALAHFVEAMSAAEKAQLRRLLRTRSRR